MALRIKTKPMLATPSRHLPLAATSASKCTLRASLPRAFVSELQVGTVNVGEVPGYRLEPTPFGGIKDSGLG